MAFKQSVNYQQIQLAVEALICAKRIFIFGLGLSSATAKDAEYKFYQSGLFASYIDDLKMQRMIVSNYSAGDLFFIISQTGETKEIIEVAELAKLNNATVISMSPSASRLARVSTLKLQIDETHKLNGLSFSSQATNRVMLDILAVGISLQKDSPARFYNQDYFKNC
jgi:RpiR family carbohydrate utilization transcriptional regulator